MEFSERTGWQVSENEITKSKTSLEQEGKTILDLTVSNPTQCGFHHLEPELLKPFSSVQNFRYQPDPRGLLSAREAICRHYARRRIFVSPDQVFLTASTSEAYTFIFRLLANPNEALLAPEPSYPLFEYLAGLSDLEIKRYPLVYERGWRIQSLPDTPCRAVLTVNPNNPTGNFIHSEELGLLNGFANAGKAAIISDEVFFDFAFEKPLLDIKSFAGNQEALTFTLGGISKTLGLPQMKLAWIVVSGPGKLVREAIRRLEIICDTYLSVNTPSQNALPTWLAQADRVQKEISARLERNRTFLKQKLAAVSGARLLEADGGWYATVQVEREKSDEEWALLFLKEDHVFVHPGYFFDFPSGNFLVLSLLPPPEIFDEAVSRMARKFNLLLNAPVPAKI